MIVQTVTASKPRWPLRATGWGTGLAVLCLASVGVVAADGDVTSLLVLLAVPVGFAAMLLILRGIRTDPRATAAIVFMTGFILDGTVRYREYADKSADGQVLVKVASWIIIGIIAIRNLKGNAQAFLTPVYFCWTMLYAWFLLTTTWAHFPLFSIISVGSLIIFHLFSLHLAVRFSEISIVTLIVSTITTVCVLSIFVYLLFPSIGRSIEFVENAKVMSSRMRGITGSPNAIGAQAGFGLCLISLYWRDLTAGGRIWPAAAAVACLLAVILSQNRSVLMALAPILIVYYGLRPRMLPWTVILAVAVLCAVSLVAVLVPDPLALLSRSGKGTEITTATNRGVIWLRVIELWKDEPIFGYGYGSMLFYLPNSPGLFQAASHAHNIFLECLVSSGLIGFGLFLTSLGVTIIAAVRNRATRPLGLLVFILIKGLTEALPFNGVASFTAFALSLCVALIAVASSTGAARPRARVVPATRIRRPADARHRGAVTVARPVPEHAAQEVG